METGQTQTHQTRIIPAPGTVPKVERDAMEAFRVLKAGGVIVVPTDVGYGIMSSSAEGIERAFAAKKRRPGHALGIIGTYRQHAELHILSDNPAENERLFALTRAVTVEVGGTVAFVARYHPSHPRLQQFSPQTMDRATKGDTLGIAVPESPFLTELGRLNDEDGQLMVGSSANLSGQGQKCRVEDIEPEVLEAADLIVDYGLQKWHLYGRAGTIFDLTTMKVLRFGVNYEVFRERMRKWGRLELPEDPEHKTDGRKAIGISVMNNSTES
ncbi:hypothetical protein GQ53DRAFT_754055 [Thozetella sp. PMI_491]|nr:hypothetical protein GQ53DRAFT_754055 [Thozetella sp. PMI_491]